MRVIHIPIYEVSQYVRFGEDTPCPEGSRRYVEMSDDDIRILEIGRRMCAEGYDQYAEERYQAGIVDGQEMQKMTTEDAMLLDEAKQMLSQLPPVNTEGESTTLTDCLDRIRENGVREGIEIGRNREKKEQHNQVN